MDTLNGFPYNYQLLYCAYTGVGAVFQAIVKCWLLRREMSASQKIQVRHYSLIFIANIFQKLIFIKESFKKSNKTKINT